MANKDKKYVRWDYKDLERLEKLVTQRGKIYSRKRSGNNAKQQREAQRAVKQARYIGLLPFCNQVYKDTLRSKK